MSPLSRKTESQHSSFSRGKSLPLHRAIPTVERVSTMVTPEIAPDTEEIPRPVSSRRVRQAWPPVVDNIINKYGNRVRFNLAPGAPYFGMCDEVRLKVAALLGARQNTADLSRYGDVLGSLALRQSWASVILHGYDSDSLHVPAPKDIECLLPRHELMITAGANQAFVNVILALCDGGDEVLLILPYYFSHYNALAVTGVTPVCVPVDKRTLLPHVASIRERISGRSRALVVVNPGNPSGKVFDRVLMDSITRLCRDQKIWLIIDEAYREFAYESTAQLAYSPSADDGIIHIYTMSKAYGLAGWRIGAVMYPKRISEEMRKVQDTIPTHPAKFSEAVALEALRYNPVAHSIERPSKVVQLGEVRKVFVRALRRVYRNSILADRFVVPDGAFYFFLPYNTLDGELPSRRSDMQVVEYLATQHNILVSPGFTFGMEGYIRVSYGCVEISSADEVSSALALGLSIFLPNKMGTPS